MGFSFNVFEYFPYQIGSVRMAARWTSDQASRTRCNRSQSVNARGRARSIRLVPSGYTPGALWLHSWEEEMMTVDTYDTSPSKRMADFCLMLTVCGGVLGCADFLEN